MQRRLIIISGGQSGVDRAALDVALARGIPYGGWCPKGGWAEDFYKPPGVSARYPLLRETPSAEPAERTEWNVRDSDASLILLDAGGIAVSSGTALAERFSAQYAKPLLVVDVGATDVVDRISAWLSELLAAPPPDAAHASAAAGSRATANRPDVPDSPDSSDSPDASDLRDAMHRVGDYSRLAVGGPRESEAPGIYEKAKRVLEEVADGLVR